MVDKAIRGQFEKFQVKGRMSLQQPSPFNLLLEAGRENFPKEAFFKDEWVRVMSGGECVVLWGELYQAKA